jgi:hypothetical protein
METSNRPGRHSLVDRTPTIVAEDSWNKNNKASAWNHISKIPNLTLESDNLPSLQLTSNTY